MDKPLDLKDYEDYLPPDDNFEEDVVQTKNGNAAKK